MGLEDTTGASTERFQASGAGTVLGATSVTPTRVSSSASGVATGDAATAGNVRFEPLSGSPGRRKPALDRALIERAEEVLDGVEHSSPEEMALAFESLRYVTCELWNSAASASIQHQSLLAMIEAYIAGRETLSHNQAAALRGAVKDLSSSSLSEQHLDVIRSRFIDEGHNPLVILSELEGNPRDWEADGGESKP